MSTREVTTIQLNIPIPSAFAGSPGAPSGQGGAAMIHALRVIVTKANDGTVKSTQHLTWPLINEDFTPDFVADINAALAELGLEIKPLQAPV